MIKRFLRRWLGVETEIAPDNYEGLIRTNNYLGSTLAETAPTISAYKISNGFIIRTTNKMLINQTMTLPQFTYCKDAEAIANHIVADTAREAIGVGSQYELFDKSTATLGTTPPTISSLVGTGSLAAQIKTNY
jgi:hypothetical protein